MKTMKTKNSSIKALLITMALVASPAVVFAQNDDLLASTDDVLNSEQIDIDGTFEERRESAADRIAKLRKRLESQNEEMMQKKIEGERIKSEKKLEKKLRRVFTGQSNTDRISTRQAAPQKLVAVAPVAAPRKIKRTAVIPSLGVSQTLSDNGNSESKIDLGLNIEHSVHENVAVGFGIGYSKMQFDDPYSDLFGNQFGLQPTAAAEGEDTKDYDYEYSRINVNLNTKFYFTGLDSKFRPYVGAGLGYNRVTVSDTNPNDDCNQTNGNFGGCNINSGNGFGFQNPDQDTEISDSMVSATANIGTNLLFNDMVGMNINFSYTKFLTSAFDNNENDALLNSFNSNEEKIRGVGKSISEDSVAGISAGVVIQF